MPAMIGMRPAQCSTAVLISRQCSSTSTVGDSPVVPTTTMPSVPSAMCQSRRDLKRGEVERAVGLHGRDDRDEAAGEHGCEGAGRSKERDFTAFPHPRPGSEPAHPPGGRKGAGSPPAAGRSTTTVLVGHHAQLAAHRLEQLARAPAGSPGWRACRSARCRARRSRRPARRRARGERDEHRQQRPVQVVGHHDARRSAGPRRATGPPRGRRPRPSRPRAGRGRAPDRGRPRRPRTPAPRGSGHGVPTRRRDRAPRRRGG